MKVNFFIEGEMRGITAVSAKKFIRFEVIYLTLEIFLPTHI